MLPRRTPLQCGSVFRPSALLQHRGVPLILRQLPPLQDQRELSFGSYRCGAADSSYRRQGHEVFLCTPQAQEGRQVLRQRETSTVQGQDRAYILCGASTFHTHSWRQGSYRALQEFPRVVRFHVPLHGVHPSEERGCQVPQGSTHNPLFQWDGVLSIDPGVSNLLTCTAFSNGKPDAFIIDGRHIKSINCYYNKAMARLKAIYAKDSKVQGTTARMRRLINGRKNRIDACFNSIAKYITDYCLANGIGTIVIGYNKGQQEGIDMGKTNNQNFAYIPFYKLRRKLMGRCALYGIKYESQEESYTSKASALSLDAIPNYGDKDIPEFSGYRQKRGLYKIKNEPVTINADANGSINIYRKYLKCKSNADLSADDVRVFVNRPVMRISALH